jgi:hypothetical protein
LIGTKKLINKYVYRFTNLQLRVWTSHLTNTTPSVHEKQKKSSKRPYSQNIPNQRSFNHFHEFNKICMNLKNIKIKDDDEHPGLIFIGFTI